MYNHAKLSRKINFKFNKIRLLSLNTRRRKKLIMEYSDADTYNKK